jgi:hemerythrin-like metal-binding protein
MTSTNDSGGKLARHELIWKPEYSVGVAKFDEQHQKLFGMLTDLYDVLQGAAVEERLREVIHELLLYTITHFSDEEAEMFRTGYPAYPAHKSEHDALMEKTRQFDVQAKSSMISTKMLCIEMIAVLSDWLKEHIAKVDKEYAEHMVANGVR